MQWRRFKNSRKLSIAVDVHVNGIKRMERRSFENLVVINNFTSIDPFDVSSPFSLSSYSSRSNVGVIFENSSLKKKTLLSRNAHVSPIVSIPLELIIILVTVKRNPFAPPRRKRSRLVLSRRTDAYQELTGTVLLVSLRNDKQRGTIIKRREDKLATDDTRTWKKKKKKKN